MNVIVPKLEYVEVWEGSAKVKELGNHQGCSPVFHLGEKVVIQHVVLELRFLPYMPQPTFPASGTKYWDE